MRLAFSSVKEWHSRWCHLAGTRTIHRVRRIEDPRGWKDFPSGPGETVCGKTGRLWMPGIVSRLSGKRCAACCKAVGISKGIGAPYNDPSCYPPEGEALSDPARRSTGIDPETPDRSADGT